MSPDFAQKARRIVSALMGRENYITFQDQKYLSVEELELALKDRKAISDRYGMKRGHLDFGSSAFEAQIEVVQEILEGKR